MNPASSIAMAPDITRRHDKIIAGWLFGVAAMVFVMIVIGGLTRLTESGLSMVHWRPVTGWLPPLSQAEWLAVFDAYRDTPEYLLVNAGMSLDQFKEIFWFEYIHRLWGRLIGLAFAVPCVLFLLRGWIGRAMVPRLVGLFVLGGLQGVLGWYMVQSGLVDRPDVSQYRLVAHLGAALLIYGALVWTALQLWCGDWPRRSAMASTARAGTARPVGAGPPWRHAMILVLFVTVTALSGGFVAGLNAGQVYNTFPLMDGELIPSLLFSAAPAYLSPFEDVTTVQFNHRVLALVTVALAVALWLRARRCNGSLPVSWATGAVAIAAVLQMGLGIATLLLMVPLGLAAVHQAGAVVLFTAALWATFACRRERPLARASVEPVVRPWSGHDGPRLSSGANAANTAP